DTAVQRDHRGRAPRGVSDFNFAEDRREPLVAIAAKCTGFWFAFERAVHDGAKIADLRKAERVPCEPPDLRVRLGEPEKVSPLALPPRRSTEALEASLPCLVEFNEQLCAD